MTTENKQAVVKTTARGKAFGRRILSAFKTKTAGLRDALVSALQAEKASYVVTVFVAALGWTAIRTSDRLQQTPFVEYQVSSNTVTQRGDAPYALVQLRNVTSGKSFECFRIELLGSSFSNSGDDQYVSYRAAVAARASAELSQSNNWRFKVQDFMPGADIVLGAPQTKSAPFKVLVRPCEAPTTDGMDGSKRMQLSAPILMNRSLVTSYVEHELTVLWSGLVLWLIALVYINSLKQQDKSVQTG